MSNIVLVAGEMGINLEEIMKECYSEISENKVVVRTKYYKASVEFVFIKNLKEEVEEGKFQGIILIFNSKETFEKVKEFYTIQVKGSVQNQICLKIVNDDKSPKLEKKFLDSVNSWCIEKKMELVEMDVEPTRVQEALKCTMWPIMEMGNFLQKKERESKKEEVKQEEEPKKEEKEEEEGEEEVEGEKEKGKNEKNGEKKNIHDLIQKIIPKEEEEEETETEDKTEKSIDEFDGLLKKMIHLKNTGNSLGDEERRKRAGNLAMTLFKMLDEDEKKDSEKKND